MVFSRGLSSSGLEEEFPALTSFRCLEQKQQQKHLERFNIINGGLEREGEVSKSKHERRTEVSGQVFQAFSTAAQQASVLSVLQKPQGQTAREIFRFWTSLALGLGQRHWSLPPFPPEEEEGIAMKSEPAAWPHLTVPKGVLKHGAKTPHAH